jgi:hypothetical protein
MSDTPPIPLYRRLTVGEIVERVYRLLRCNFVLLVGIAVFPGLAFLLSYAAIFAVLGRRIISTARISDPEEMMRLFRLISVVSIPAMMVCLIVFALYLAAASYAAVLADCGTRVTIREAYRVASARKGHYFLLTLTLYALTFLPALLLELPLFATASSMEQNKTVNPLMVLLFPVEAILIAVAVVVGIILALRLSLAFAASVFEALTVRDAIKRSWNLTRGALGRIFLSVAVIYAAIYAVTIILILGAISVATIVYLLAGRPNDPHSSILLVVILGLFIYLIFLAVCTVGTWAGFTTAFAVIYNDQRLRLEGQPPAIPTGVPA